MGEILVDRGMAAEVPCPSEDYPVVAFRAAFHLKDGASQMEDGLMPVVVAGDKTSSVNLQNFDALSFSLYAIRSTWLPLCDTQGHAGISIRSQAVSYNL